MMALGEWEDSRCPICGGDPEMCQSPDADRNNPQGKWVWWPSLRECHVGTAVRTIEHKPEDRRALIPKAVRKRRGEPGPRMT